jgi:hypothetical protein
MLIVYTRALMAAHERARAAHTPRSANPAQTFLIDPTLEEIAHMTTANIPRRTRRLAAPAPALLALPLIAASIACAADTNVPNGRGQPMRSGGHEPLSLTI